MQRSRGNERIMGDEATIEEYNKLRCDYDELLVRYRDLQKKYNRLVAEKGDVFTDCNNCMDGDRKWLALLQE